jgi:hypothetical protein
VQPTGRQDVRVSEFVSLDVTEWEAAGDETLGSKPKQWLYEPGNERRWLWKEATMNPYPHKSGQYKKGDDWAEKVACEIARLLELPAAEVQLAYRAETMGTICLDFTDRQLELTLGNELLSGQDPGYTEASRRGDPRYTVAAVFAAINEVQPPINDTTLKTAVDWFYGYLVLDAVIGNTDRHHDNWGALRREDTLALAPSFDHASSLGFLLSDEERSGRLKDGTVREWADRARTPFAKRHHPRTVALDAINMVEEQVAEAWLQRLSPLLEGGEKLIQSVPLHRMSESSKRFAVQLLRHNTRQMMSRMESRIRG